MSFHGSGEGLCLRSPAKINLGLRVLGLRADGYHEVETWIQQVALFDRIRVRPGARAVRVAVRGGGAPSGRENLAHRAAAALRAEAGDPSLGARIELEKNIPSGAGLGGGSGNAAAVLWALNRIWGLKFSVRVLTRIAAGIGSDVPAFLAGPAAMCSGRGEIVSRRKPLRQGWFLLVKPPFSLPTPRVYGWMRKSLKNHGRASRIKLRPKQIKTPEFKNDLEEVVFGRYPLLREFRDALLSAGAEKALMSGSGPAMWGVFRTKSAAGEAAIKFSRKFDRRFRGRRFMVRLVKPLTYEAISSVFLDPA